VLVRIQHAPHAMFLHSTLSLRTTLAQTTVELDTSLTLTTTNVSLAVIHAIRAMDQVVISASLVLVVTLCKMVFVFLTAQ
jgi:hypothetical protein